MGKPKSCNVDKNDDNMATVPVSLLIALAAAAAAPPPPVAVVIVDTIIILHEIVAMIAGVVSLTLLLFYRYESIYYIKSLHILTVHPPTPCKY